MDHLSLLDTSFLRLETLEEPMTVASVVVLEGPAPTYDEVCDRWERRLPGFVRYRQVVAEVPMHAGYPAWQDDRTFRLDYHVRHTALPAPGGEVELDRLVGRVMAQRLDRAKPLWELWLVEGLAEGRWALIAKVHHCMVDGVSGMEMLAGLFDGRDADSPSGGPSWTPRAERPAAALVLGSARSQVAHAWAGLRSARRGGVAGLVKTAAAVVAGGSRLLPVARGVDGPLNGRLGPHRIYVRARLALADVKRVRARLGGTVNDVVLACVAHGVRELLIARGVDPGLQEVRSMVPVSVRRPGEIGDYNNRVSSVFPRLPVEAISPAERLHRVTAEMDDLKRSGQAVAGEVLTSLTGFAPALLLTLAARAAAASGQPSVQLVTTNIPGPQQPMCLLGRRVREVSPYVPLGGEVLQSVGVFSYDGQMFFGITGDGDRARDVAVLAQGIEDGLDALLAAAGAGTRESGA